MNQSKSDGKTSLIELFFVFAKIGVMTFGGGYAMLPILQREIVDNRHWASDEDLANYFAIGQCTPGVIAVNTATFIGYQSRGILGGIAATLGVVFPSLIIISFLAGIIARFSDNIFVQKAFTGIRICVCALILKAVLKLYTSAVKDKLTLGVFLIASLVAIFLDLSPIILILTALVVGIILQYVSCHQKKANKEGDNS